MAAEVSVDKTFFIQAGIFLASYGVLRGLVFGPYTQLLKVRAEKSSLLKEKAGRQKAEALLIQEKYETFMKGERLKLNQWSGEERKRIDEEQKKIVQSARDQANVVLKAKQSKLSQEISEVRKTLLPKVSEYASLLASSIVGKKVVVTNSPKSNPDRKSSEAALT